MHQELPLAIRRNHEWLDFICANKFTDAERKFLTCCGTPIKWKISGCKPPIPLRKHSSPRGPYSSIHVNPTPKGTRYVACLRLLSPTYVIYWIHLVFPEEFACTGKVMTRNKIIGSGNENGGNQICNVQVAVGSCISAAEARFFTFQATLLTVVISPDAVGWLPNLFPSTI